MMLPPPALRYLPHAVYYAAILISSCRERDAAAVHAICLWREALCRHSHGDMFAPSLA